MLRRPYELPGIVLRLAKWKASTLPTVLFIALTPSIKGETCVCYKTKALNLHGWCNHADLDFRNFYNGAEGWLEWIRKEEKGQSIIG